MKKTINEFQHNIGKMSEAEYVQGLVLIANDFIHLEAGALGEFTAMLAYVAGEFDLAEQEQAALLRSTGETADDDGGELGAIMLQKNARLLEEWHRRKMADPQWVAREELKRAALDAYNDRRFKALRWLEPMLGTGPRGTLFRSFADTVAELVANKCQGDRSGRYAFSGGSWVPD